MRPFAPICTHNRALEPKPSTTLENRMKEKVVNLIRNKLNFCAWMGPTKPKRHVLFIHTNMPVSPRCGNCNLVGRM